MSENTHILIIDDNEDIVMMLKAMLSLKGYKVEVRTNAIGLKEHIESITPDLILMDMLLSGADGREICEELKADSAFSTIPILMISAHPSAQEDCLAAGTDYFLAKPFEMKDLFAMVNKALDK